MRSHRPAILISAVLGVFLLLLIQLVGASAKSAEPLARPSGTVILIVTGSISQSNAPGRAEFDRKMLETLGIERITTSTNWMDGKVVFEGVLVRKVLEAVGATGKTITATGLDGYAIDIPVDDFNRYEVLLALSMNGRALARSDKGPIWIVYPRDDYPELRDPTINARWVWQLKSIDVK